MAARSENHVKWYDILTLLGGLAACGVLILLLISNPIIAQPPKEVCPPACPDDPPIAARDIVDDPPIAARGIVKDYVVKKGDTLWGIAASEEQYDNPYWWPIIYRDNSNKPKIIDPDLILPNQKFSIPPIAVSRILKDDTRPQALPVSDWEKKDAETFAKTRGPWSLYDGK